MLIENNKFKNINIVSACVSLRYISVCKLRSASVHETTNKQHHHQ